MRESFSEYKKTLEMNLMNIHYLFNGDINFSTDEIYEEVKNSPLTSPSVMINCITKIYEDSFNILKSKSREFIISEESIKMNNWEVLDKSKVMNIISVEIGSYPAYVFTDEKTFHKIGFDNKFKLDNSRPFPSYFYPLTKLVGLHTDIMFSPLIDESDDYIIYATDKSFQSLVYSVQNMEYDVEIINKSDTENYKPYHEIEWKHTIRYKLYDCNFNSLKVIIRNISKIRDEKIDKILNDN